LSKLNNGWPHRVVSGRRETFGRRRFCLGGRRVQFFQTKSPILSNDAVVSNLQNLGTPPGAPGDVHLVTAVAEPITPHTTLAQFTEAAFPGYAAVSMGSSTNVVADPRGKWQAWAFSCEFLCTGPVSGIGVLVLGYYLDDGLGNVVSAELFPVPFPILGKGDGVTLSILYPILTQPQL
jgi:hypothetical protein